MDYEDGAVTVCKDWMTVRADDACDIAGFCAADHRKLHRQVLVAGQECSRAVWGAHGVDTNVRVLLLPLFDTAIRFIVRHFAEVLFPDADRKSTRLNSSHPSISYAV